MPLAVAIRPMQIWLPDPSKDAKCFRTILPTPEIKVWTRTRNVPIDEWTAFYFQAAPIFPEFLRQDVPIFGVG